MARNAKQLIEIAASQVGYMEKASNSQLDDFTANAGSGNYTKYARDLFAAGYYNGNKNGFEWCDVFVDWCFYQLCGKDAQAAQKMICQSGDLGAGVGYSQRYYKAQNRFFAEPQAGDQIFFGTSHTGIVEKVESGIIYTIEGNTDNKVERRRYTLDYNEIAGYGRPYYKEEAEMTKNEVRTLCKEEIAAEKSGSGTGTAHSEWAEEAIRWATENGIINGFGDGDMGFEKLITREQAITMLYRLATLMKEG